MQDLKIRVHTIQDRDHQCLKMQCVTKKLEIIQIQDKIEAWETILKWIKFKGLNLLFNIRICKETIIIKARILMLILHHPYTIGMDKTTHLLTKAHWICIQECICQTLNNFHFILNNPYHNFHLITLIHLTTMDILILNQTVSLDHLIMIYSSWMINSTTFLQPILRTSHPTISQIFHP